MTQAVIDIDEYANRVLNIVKAKYGLRNKSQAIELVVAEYEQMLLAPELRPDYIDRLQTISKGRHRSREELERELETD